MDEAHGRPCAKGLCTGQVISLEQLGEVVVIVASLLLF